MIVECVDCGAVRPNPPDLPDATVVRSPPAETENSVDSDTGGRNKTLPGQYLPGSEVVPRKQYDSLHYIQAWILLAHTPPAEYTTCRLTMPNG